MYAAVQLLALPSQPAAAYTSSQPALHSSMIKLPIRSISSVLRALLSKTIEPELALLLAEEEPLCLSRG